MIKLPLIEFNALPVLVLPNREPFLVAILDLEGCEQLFI
jgi:hypothetical protein